MSRKWLALISTLILLSAAFGGISLFSAADGLKGDVDGNGAVNTSDVRMILQSMVGKSTLTEDQKLRADVNNDGMIDTTDARMILQYIVGKIDTLEPTTEDTTMATEDTITTETTETTATQPDLGPHLSQYLVKEVNAMPEGTDVPINHTENLGNVPGWDPSAAAIVTSVDELQNCGITFSDELMQKYDTAFFEDNALLLMAMPVGHANVNHQIDSLIRTGDDLCLNTTIYWTEGEDMTVRVTWRFAFEVNKADVAGVGTVNRYTFDERDDVKYPPQVRIPDINQSFTDNDVVVIIKSAYSTGYTGHEMPYSFNDFPGLDVDNIQIINPGIFSSDNQWSVLDITLKTHSKEHVIWVLSVLAEMNIVLGAEADILNDLY